MSRKKRAGQETQQMQWSTLVLPLIILLLVIGTYARNEIYRDDVALWRDTVRHSPEKVRPNNNLGAALMKFDRWTEAEPYLQKAVSNGAKTTKKGTDIELFYAQAANNLTVTLSAQGKFQEALPYLNVAGRILPWNAGVHANAGMYLALLGRSDEAIGQLEWALRLDPNCEQAIKNLNLIRGLMEKK